MSKETYSLYDFPELLYNSKIFTNRQRCIILCLFSFLNLKGGGAFTIDILAERTGIRKNHIYEEIKRLSVKTPDGREIAVIKREGRKILLDVENLRNFIEIKLKTLESPNLGQNKSQNRTNEVPKRDSKSPKMGLTEVPKQDLNKSQNGTKKSPEAQEPQSPDKAVNKIFRKDFLDNSFRKELKEKSTDNKAAPQSSDSGSEEEGKKIDRGIVERITEEIIREFKLRYKRRYNRYPVIDPSSRKRVVDTLLLSAENEEELSDIAKNAISKIPAFFFLNDKWVIKQGHSFFAFSYRLGDLLSKPINKPNVNDGWGRKKEVGEVKAW